MGVRYYQAPDGTGIIKHHPFCVFTMNADGEKEYTLDDEGNRIRSIRITKAGSPYTTPDNGQLQRITRDDFLNRRRPTPTKKQVAAIEDEIKAHHDLLTTQTASMGESVEHVHDEHCDHTEEDEEE